MSIIDTARREWLTRAILLNARLERERLRYAKSGGRPLETRQLEEAEARVSEHWANAATLVHPEGTES